MKATQRDTQWSSFNWCPMKRWIACAATVIYLVAPSLASGDHNFIAGGTEFVTPLHMWEIRDSSSNVITSGDLSFNRVGHCAVRLTNGNVFLAGGSISPTTWEIHDKTGALVGSGFLANSRDFNFTCTLLSNGNVMIAGGQTAFALWEIRSNSGSLVSTGSLAQSRVLHTATLLGNGNVFIAGGTSALTLWEIRNGSGGLVSTGSLNASRQNHCAVLLANGNIFLGGGGSSASTWEIRNPAGGLVSNGMFLNNRDFGFTCNRLLDTKVFIAGGQTAGALWEIRNESGGLVSNGSLALNRRKHKAQVQIDTGNVLIVGGQVGSGGNSWELRSSSGALISQGGLDPARTGGHTMSELDTIPPTPPSGLTAIPLSTTQVSLTWTASTDFIGVDHYEVWRSFNNSAYAQIAQPATTSFVDTNLTPTTAYLYKVRAVDAAGNVSGFSNTDLATTVVFTEDPLLAGITVVKAVHLT